MIRRSGLLLLVLFGVVTAPAVLAARADAQTFYVNSTTDTDTSAIETACLNTVTVSTPAADGTTCTLRSALIDVNGLETANPGTANVVEFTQCGPYDVTAALPTIPAGTYIDGGDGISDPSSPYHGCQDTFTQWYPNGDGTYATFNDSNYGFVHLQDQGPSSGTFDGLVLDGSGSTLTGVVIGGFRNAIVLNAPGSDIVEESAVGNDAYEGGPLNPENTGNGIEVEAGSAHDKIGYSLAADGTGEYTEYIQDDIYGNGGWGVYLAKGSGPTVVGHNFIGTDTSGDAYACDGPLPSGFDGCPSYGNDPCPVGTSPTSQNECTPTATADSPAIPDGNGRGGVYDDGSGDLIGGTIPCENLSDPCTTNVIAGNLGPGIEFGPDASDDTATSNDIGESLDFYQSPTTDAGALPNAGPGLEDGGTDDSIGGSSTGQGNLVSGNAGPGILLEGSSALVENNLVGLDYDGTAATPNQGPGIRASDGAGVSPGNNRILDNTIGGNTGPGVQLDQAGNTVDGNFIGTAGDQASPLANSAGIVADRGPQTIGGITSDPNLIANNLGPGIEVVDPSASTYVNGVNIYDNEIFANSGLEIDLGDDGVTPNHSPDTTSGPNGFTNFPVLSTASAADGQWIVHGTLDALPSTYYNIYLYGDSACDGSGYGPGETFVAGGSVGTDTNGHVAFALDGSGPLPPVLSAYAVGGSGTSEFSQCIDVGGGAALTATQSVTGGADVISGEPADIDLHLANAGPAAATNTVIKLTVPAGETISSPPAGCAAVKGASFSCDVGTIAAGSSLDVHVILTPAAGVQTLTDTLTVNSDQVQLNSASSTLNVTVLPNPQQPSSVNQSIAEPAPTFGEYLRLDRVAGTVTARLPNGQRIDLRNYALIPVGTVVSTSQGQAKLTAALKGGRTTQADFKYGQFKVAQSKATGLINAQMNAPLRGCSAQQLSTQLRRGDRVTEASPARDPFTTVSGPLGPRLTPAARLGLTSTPAHRRRTRRLWGHDTGGSYQITGNRGAATVQGTIWEVLDTCTTTTVIVYQDSVKVVGFGNTVPKRATVSAGHRVVLRASK